MVGGLGEVWWGPVVAYEAGDDAKACGGAEVAYACPDVFGHCALVFPSAFLQQCVGRYLLFRSVRSPAGSCAVWSNSGGDGGSFRQNLDVYETEPFCVQSASVCDLC